MLPTVIDAPRLARAIAVQPELLQRPLQGVIDPIVGLCQRWCQPADPLRQRTITLLEECTGHHPSVIAWGLDTTIGSWIGQQRDEAAAIRELLQAELTQPASLGTWVPGFRPGEEYRWVPVSVTLQILAGNVFAALFHQLLAGVLSRSVQLVRCASGQKPMLALFIEGLSQVDPDLAALLVPVTFDHQDTEALDAAVALADVITITGADAAVEAVTYATARVNAADGRGRVVHGFGHRVSAAYLAHAIWHDPERLVLAASALAIDTCAYDQQGCLSPHVVFAEDALPTDLPVIGAALFAALQEQTVRWPVGVRHPAFLSARRAWLDTHRMRGGHPGLPHCWADDNIAVVTDPDTPIKLLPGGRTLVLAPVGFPQGVLERLRPWQEWLGTLGVALHPAVPLKGFRQSSGLFGKGPSGEVTGPGFNRVCVLGQMQTPSLSEPHDGRPRLRLMLRQEKRQVAGKSS